MTKNSFNRWEFIECWLPDYTSNQDVAWSNDLDKYINGEYDYTDPVDRERLNDIAEVCPTMEDALIEREHVDSLLFIIAREAWKENNNKS